MSRTEMQGALSGEECGRRLKEARIAAGFETTAAAASRLNISYHRLYDLESGKRVPGWDSLHAIAVGLGLDPEILFPELMEGRKGRKKGPNPKVKDALRRVVDTHGETLSRLAAAPGKKPEQGG